MYGSTDPNDPERARRRRESPADEPTWLTERPEPRSAYLFGDEPDQPGDRRQSDPHRTEPTERPRAGQPTARWEQQPDDEPWQEDPTGRWQPAGEPRRPNGTTAAARRRAVAATGRPGSGVPAGRRATGLARRRRAHPGRAVPSRRGAHPRRTVRFRRGGTAQAVPVRRACRVSRRRSAGGPSGRAYRASRRSGDERAASTRRGPPAGPPLPASTADRWGCRGGHPGGQPRRRPSWGCPGGDGPVHRRAAANGR